MSAEKTEEKKEVPAPDPKKVTAFEKNIEKCSIVFNYSNG